MPVNFRDYRFFETHTEQMVHDLQVRFYGSPSRLGTLSHYLPLSRLRELIDSLILGEYDGLKICFGMRPIAETGQQSYELVLTEVQLRPSATDPLVPDERPGNAYLSTTQFATTAANALAVASLKTNFQRLYPAPTVHGSFIGLNQLQEFCEAEAEGFDGLEIWYGLEPPQFAGQPEQFRLMMRLVKWGRVFVSVPDMSTEPTGIGCPPLKCA
jgi:hypothetical protein